MTEVTAKEEGRVNMGRSVKMEHMKQPRGRKHQGGSSAPLKRRNYRKCKIYQKQQLLKDTFIVKIYGIGLLVWI